VDTLGEAVRRTRGKQSRRAFVRELERKTGISLTDKALYEIEKGRKAPGLDKSAEALIAAYPELAPFFLPESIYRAIKHTCKDSASQTGEAA